MKNKKIKISLENRLRNKIDELECIHEFGVSTDTVRCWLDEHIGQSEKKSIYNYIATNLREEASHLLGSIQQCFIHKAITNDEAKRLRSLVNDFYKLSYELEKK